MQLLLDTHIVLWWLNADKRLPNVTVEMVAQADKVYVSSISIWEAVIKAQIGKLTVNIQKLREGIITSDFQELAFTSEHAATVSELKAIHNDPFDRALIAQAVSEPLRFLTVDNVLSKYSELVQVI